MDTMKFYNVTAVPTISSAEGTYYVKDANGYVQEYLVTGGLVKYIGGYPMQDKGTDLEKPMSQKAVTDELNAKVSKDTQINVGAGLTGGGTLEQDINLDIVSANDGITVNADNIQLNTQDVLNGTSTTKPLSAKQGAELNNRINMYGTAGGTAQAITLAVSASITLSAGMRFTFKPIANNTATNPTININNLGAKTILRGINAAASDALIANDIVQNIDAILEYDGTNFRLLNPQTGGIAQTTGADTDKVMSQKAVTDELNAIATHTSDTSNPHSVTKAQVGLGSVDNTSDANKPISTAQAAAIKTVQDDVTSHKNNTSNPHSVTKAQVGLGNVDNTSDLAKPISTATQAALDSINSQLLQSKYNLAYGVEWDTTVASPVLTRIGNSLLHKQLPIQSGLRGCVCKGSQIVYFLDANDWSKKADGTASVLDGTDGTVRVYVPEFWGKSEIDGNKRRVWISTTDLGGWTHIPAMVIDAYKCTVDTTVTDTPKAVSVINTSAAFRGGGNRTDYDTYLTTDVFRADLGKPRTNISRAQMRTYARNAGSELLCYEYYKWIMYWLFVIEYATFNSQATYNAALTSDGYHQGGLGAGISNMSDWDKYNASYPITPCGYGNSLGNFTGIKEIPTLAYTGTDSANYTRPSMYIARYRGFENPFGDIWTNLEGIVLKRSAANASSIVYTTTESANFDDLLTNKLQAGTEIASDGYTTKFDLGSNAEIIPSAVGGSLTTYICDYHWCSAANTYPRALLVGGIAISGTSVGLGCFNSAYGVSISGTYIGFRTMNLI